MWTCSCALTWAFEWGLSRDPWPHLTHASIGLDPLAHLEGLASTPARDDQWHHLVVHPLCYIHKGGCRDPALLPHGYSSIGLIESANISLQCMVGQQRWGSSLVCGKILYLGLLHIV